MGRIAQLRVIWNELNAAHFSGGLRPVPIRVTRSRRTYGYYTNKGGGSIRVSKVLADTPELARGTMGHEMIHQHLHETNVPDWDEHGPAFQRLHERIFGHQYVEPA
jgi:predicted SprT family Zn-dependent metalloprotease